MSDLTTIPDGCKCCSKRDKCVHPNGPILPATNEYFSKKSAARDGMCTECKYCCKSRCREYYSRNRERITRYDALYQKTHREKLTEYRRKYRREHIEEAREASKIDYEKHKQRRLDRAKYRRLVNKKEDRRLSPILEHKCCSKCNMDYPATKDYFVADKDVRSGITNVCKNCNSQYQTRYRKQHEAHRKSFREKYYKTHREEICLASRNYRLQHADRIRQRNKDWRKKNATKILILNKVRATKKRSLPSDYNEIDYNFSIEYFHGACAYCENPPSLFDIHTVLHMEHFIPLSSPSCPGTIRTNMLPACQSCNLQKGNKNPYEWILIRFGKRRAKRVLARIETYFAEVQQCP